MAIWTEMSYNKSYNRHDELVREEMNYYECDVISYGLIENLNKNCYGVEEVYDDLNNWN